MGERGELTRRKKLVGKGWEYHHSSLPKSTRDHLLRKLTAEAAEAVESKPIIELDTPVVAELTDRQRERMNARLAILGIVNETAMHVGLAKAVAGFLDQANSGALPPQTQALLAVAKTARAGKNTIDRATLYRWLKAEEKGAAAVAPRNPPKKGHPEWLAPLLKLYQKPQKPSVAKCINKYWPEHYPDTDAPNLRAAQRVIKSLPVEIAAYGRMGKHARRAVQPFVRRTFDGLWPMDVVTVDGHLFKAYVENPATHRRFRPEITTYLDIATRKAIGFSAWYAESQFAIWSALRDMVLNPDYGVPAIHYSDNGAYRGEQHRATCTRIGTTIMFSEAYRAQARGVIERFNSSVWHPLAKDLSTYCGADVDQQAFKKALKRVDKEGVGLVGWLDFVAGCQAALDEYNDRPHRSLKGLSPNQAWARAIDEGWTPTRLENDDMRDILPSVTRKVSRGEITLPWGRYFNKTLSLHHGHEVTVAFQPTKGEHVWVSDVDGKQICVAKRDANARPYVAESQMDHARAKREKAALGRVERKADMIREEANPQLSAQPVDTTLTELQAQNLERLREEFEAVPAFQIPADDPARYQLWCSLSERDQLSTEEQAFYDSFSASNYCKNMQQLEAEFDQALSQ